MTASALESIVATELAGCPLELQQLFARCRIPLRAVPIVRYGVTEQVFLIAQCGDVFVYYEDVEEGFNLSTLAPDGSIRTPGYEQWTLCQALMHLAP
jgi:hypothetical protein